MMEEKDESVELFIQRLAQLNGVLARLFQSGDIGNLTEMNGLIKEMHRLQAGSDLPAFAAIDEDCKAIYGNFDMIVSVLRTTENGVIDAGAQTALNRLLHNIDRAVIRIAQTYGLIPAQA